MNFFIVPAAQPSRLSARVLLDIAPLVMTSRANNQHSANSGGPVN